MKSSTLIRRLKNNLTFQIVLVWAALLTVPVSMDLMH